MPVDIVVLIGVLAAAVGIATGMKIEQFISKMRRKAWRARNRSQWDKRGQTSIVAGPWFASPGPLDAADQLRIVMGAAFSIQPLLNNKEARLFKELDRMVIDRNPAWQVMAQVSLGEVLRCKDERAYSCINSKRVDLLLMDNDCRPRHAIEYQGRGHHRGTAAARDAVKKEALRRAGIGYHEIVAGQTTPAELRQLVDKLVEDAEQAASKPGDRTEQAQLAPDNAGRPWAPEDDGELLQLFRQGKSVSELASHFRRTQAAISARLERVGAISHRD